MQHDRFHQDTNAFSPFHDSGAFNPADWHVRRENGDGKKEDCCTRKAVVTLRAEKQLITSAIGPALVCTSPSYLLNQCLSLQPATPYADGCNSATPQCFLRSLVCHVMCSLHIGDPSAKCRDRAYFADDSECVRLQRRLIN